MDVGMLWFDNDPKLDLLNKVQKAAAYYKYKFGEEPNLCFVHPSMILDLQKDLDTVTIRSNATMLPNHFWIGVNHADRMNA